MNPVPHRVCACFFHVHLCGRVPSLPIPVAATARTAPRASIRMAIPPASASLAPWASSQTRLEPRSAQHVGRARTRTRQDSLSVCRALPARRSRSLANRTAARALSVARSAWEEQRLVLRAQRAPLPTPLAFCSACRAHWEASSRCPGHRSAAHAWQARSAHSQARSRALHAQWASSLPTPAQ